MPILVYGSSIALIVILIALKERGNRRNHGNDSYRPPTMQEREWWGRWGGGFD